MGRARARPMSREGCWRILDSEFAVARTAGASRRRSERLARTTTASAAIALPGDARTGDATDTEPNDISSFAKATQLSRQDDRVRCVARQAVRPEHRRQGRPGRMEPGIAGFGQRAVDRTDRQPVPSAAPGPARISASGITTSATTRLRICSAGSASCAPRDLE